MIARHTVAIVSLAALAGCPAEPLAPQITLHALTKPPPASVGSVTTDHDDAIFEIELSQGVALAIACSQSCEDAYGTCTSPTLTAGDAALLGVRPLYRLGGGGADHVIIAKQVGTTTLTAASACGVQSYVVHIMPRTSSE